MRDEGAIRDEVEAFLDANWDPDLELLDWRGRLVDSGWGAPTWPVEWHGRGLTPKLASVVSDAFHARGVVGVATGISMSLAAPTILEHGSDEVKGLLLRPILTGEHKWCQLFSEPGNGSDLAGLTTRAERDGDEWIVNGQKVWNSGAHKAAYGILLARTDWDVPKHAGISFFAIPMKQPGVEVRPLTQMNGYSTFNEVFLTDARVPASHIIGKPGDGWRGAVTTLAHERAAAMQRRPKYSTKSGRCAQQAFDEAADYYKTYEWYPQRAGRPDMIISRAQATGANVDPVARQQVMRTEAIVRTANWSLGRAKAARSQGRPPGPEGSLAKLNGSVIARSCHQTHALTTGAHGMLAGPESPENGIIAEILVSVPGASIAGGTDEIQHNIIGERVLGLPKEPGDDKAVPFRELRTN